MKSSSFIEIQEVRTHLRELVIERWKDEILFTPQWWVLVILLIIPWIAWWKIVDKTKLKSIFLYGMLILILNTLLDNIGTDLIWWSYPVKLGPFIPPLLTPDFTIVPILMMIVYQFFTSWKSFLIANFALSIVIAFIGEPLFIYFGFYIVHTWSLFFSFIYYNIVGGFLKWFIDFLNKQEG